MPIIFRFNLHNNWEVTIFVLNLAFAELLYCILNLPYLVYLHLNQKWDLGIQSCKISATLRYINLFANYMSVAMIATSRCVMVTKPKYFTNFLQKKNRVFILSCTWLYGLILVLPTNFEVSVKNTVILLLIQFPYFADTWPIWLQLYFHDVRLHSKFRSISWTYHNYV